MADVNELAAQVARLTMAMDQLMSRQQSSSSQPSQPNHDSSASEESDGWDDLVNNHREPGQSAFMINRLSTIPPQSVVKALVEETVPFIGVPKTPAYTKGDDRRYLQLQRKIECSLHCLAALVEDSSDQRVAMRNTLHLAALLRSSFEDVNNLRRSAVARGFTSCLDPRQGEAQLLSPEESKKLATAKSKKFSARRPQRSFRRNSQGSFRKSSSKRFSFQKQKNHQKRPQQPKD